MMYEAWRITYQSSEQAARAAYAEVVALRTAIEELHRDAAMQSEIDELREKLAALTRINSDLCRVHNERLIDTARLATDAARYRWLRKNSEWLGWDADFRPDEVDCQVDAAMKESI